MRAPIVSRAMQREDSFKFVRITIELRSHYRLSLGEPVVG
jgi:hypothetical protein